MPDIIECQEFSEIAVRVNALLKDGELRLDDRIIAKGYLSVSMRAGQVVLRATRFVGTIPLTSDLVLKITPRATISNLSYMLVKSGVIPSSISGFSRGYMPRFVVTGNAEQIYASSLIDGIKRIANRGYKKDYLPAKRQQPWRGRLLASHTIRKHAAKGIRYRHEFEQTILTQSIVENIALKMALIQVIKWLERHDRRNKILPEAKFLHSGMWHIPEWSGPKSELVKQLSDKLHALPPQMLYYRDSLWSAYLLLQSVLPELNFEGLVSLDSLIIDVSLVFEAYLRSELQVRLAEHGYTVQDGNKAPHSFFVDAGAYSVHPDIIIRRNQEVVAVLDAKYKPEPKESDRYEVVAFMDAMAVSLGGFVCPANDFDSSRFLGTTASGKEMVLFRYNLAADDPNIEADKFARNVLSMLDGSHNYL